VEIGGVSVVAVYDPRLDTDCVYHNPADNPVNIEGGRVIYDDSEYVPDTLPLDHIRTFDAMWFAWDGVYPDANVYE
jgi:hypothetical protein